MNKKEKLKDVIKKFSLLTDQCNVIVGENNIKQNWMFDLRTILMKPEYLSLVCDLFWEKYRHYPQFQIGGIETSSIPLITALTHDAYLRGKSVNGFYIRKNRKPVGAQKMIEGEILPNIPVLLVDDLINQGLTLGKMGAVLEAESIEILEYFCLIQFLPTAHYQKHITEVSIHSLFRLADFNLETINESSRQKSHVLLWNHNPRKAQYYFQECKAQCALSGENIIEANDYGCVTVRNKNNGYPKWFYQMLMKNHQTVSFGTPLVTQKSLVFASQIGTVTALNHNGTLKWEKKIFDACFSSVILNKKNSLLYVAGLSGSSNYPTSICALREEDGSILWQTGTNTTGYNDVLFIASKNYLFFSDELGVLYTLDASSGKVINSQHLNIRKRSALTFNDDFIYTISKNNTVLQISTDGEVVREFISLGLTWNDALIDNDIIYLTSEDKMVRAIKIASGETLWLQSIESRCITKATVFNSKIYVPCVNGNIFVLSAKNGVVLDVIFLPEKIANPVLIDEKENKIYASTTANQIYCYQVL